MTEKTLRQDALQTAFSIPVDIFYPQNFSCFENNGLFEQPQAIILIEIYGHRESILAAKNLMVLSASIILTLGVVHLVYTFWGPKLMPRDPALQISMSQISPVITKETTMWRAWVGFNASHSMGLILFGLVFGFLALAHGQLLFQSPFLLVVGLAMLGGFVVLCKVYFFSVPLTGISISLACYVASIALSRP